MKQLLTYSLVGFLGFLVDFGSFLLLSALVPVDWARVLAFLLAVFVTYEFNARFTFATNGRRRLYLFGQFKGFLLNFALFWFVRQLLNEWWYGEYIAFMVGSWAALAFNYLYAKRLVFRAS